MEKKDISKQTVLVLLVLAIVVMVLGSFTVYNAVDGVEVTRDETGSGADGEVNLEVEGETEPQADSESGEMTIEVVR